MVRSARCSCGGLQVEVVGDPQAVVACHCTECQRRTGSVFGVGAYFASERVKVSGDAVSFSRPAESGQPFTSHFCPKCGSTVYWVAAKNSGLVGVAVGAFADQSFPSPVRSVWERTRHPWVEIGVTVQHFSKGRPS
jgi:hypothetical protein